MTAAVIPLRRCRPEVDRTTCGEPGCTVNDPDGALARAGRDRLRAKLTEPPPESANCSCARCQGDPLGDPEAELALRHVTDRMAALFGLGLTALGGFTECDRCRVWVPSFHAAAQTTRAALFEGRRPLHG